MIETLVLGIITIVLNALVESGQEVSTQKIAETMNAWGVKALDSESWTAELVETFLENLKSEMYSIFMLKNMVIFNAIANNIDNISKIGDKSRKMIKGVYDSVKNIKRGTKVGLGSALTTVSEVINGDISHYYMNSDLNIKSWTLGSDMARTYVTGNAQMTQAKMSVKGEVKPTKSDQQQIETLNKLINALGYIEGD